MSYYEEIMKGYDNDKACETVAMNMNKKQAWQDRCLFVHNLGELLAQTREEIKGAYLDEYECVVVEYINGFTRSINVEMDSYMAIIRDVTKHL